MKIFDEVIYNNIPVNSFDLSHLRKMSMPFGGLVPSMVIETMPGDKYNLQSEHLVRAAPMIAPVMDKVNVSLHTFFVPNRILMADGEWEKFITNVDNEDSTDFSPYFTSTHGVSSVTAIEEGSTMDYVGNPTGLFPQGSYNLLPLAAIRKIWNDYYRDEDLQEELVYKCTTGDAGLNNGLNNGYLSQEDIRTHEFLKNGLWKRAWNKDYFTSARPEPQKGDPVTIGLTGTADIQFNGGYQYVRDVGTNVKVQGNLEADNTDIGRLMYDDGVTHSSGVLDLNNTHHVDLSSVSAVTIEQLRYASRMQEWLEINSRSGSRYIEFILNHYGVRSDDARLQRAEYITGGKSSISFSEVLQTSSSDDVTPQGNMSGHGINIGNTYNGNYYAKEHGWIIQLMNIQPEASYVQFNPRFNRRTTATTYPFPKFAQLGEQPVYVKELYPDQPDVNKIFGYNSRYVECKYIPNTVHGEFKSSLDFWHCGRKFGSEPILNSDFVSCNPDPRIFAVETDVHHFYAFVFHKIMATRPLPRYNIPTL